MRVPVKDMSGNYIHPTTPRKARLLIRDKKAVVDSNNPFTIRLLFSASECGLKGSSLQQNKSDLTSEEDKTMCDDRKEIEELQEELHNTYGDYIQPSLNVIMANPKNKRIKWCSKDSNSVNGENSPESFVQILYDACTMLYQQTDGRYSGNFVHVGKRGFELLQRLDPKRFWQMDNWIQIDDVIKVHYITTMPENNFIVSINNKYFKDRDKFIVGTIVNDECSEKSESEEAIKQQNKSDNNKSEKENSTCVEKISLEVEQEEQKHHFTRRTTHLIYGAYGCGKTSMIRDIINQRISNNEITMLFTTSCTKQSYYKEINSSILRIMDENSFNVTEDNNTPEMFAKYIVQYCVSMTEQLNVYTIIVDDYPFVTINEDYAEYEYFRELSKQCKENNINLIYTKGTASKENIYSSLPPIFERFSDIITVVK